MKNKLRASERLWFFRQKRQRAFGLTMLIRMDRTWAVEAIELVTERQGAVARSSTFGWTLLATASSCVAGQLNFAIFDPIWVKVVENRCNKIDSKWQNKHRRH